MLTFFPTLYPDELLYSGHARYFEILGLNNKDFRYYKFDNSIETFLKLIDWQYTYTLDYLLYQHTLFPIYKMLLSRDTITKILQGMHCHSEKFYNRDHAIIQRATLSYLSYCPICAQDDIDNVGEPYWHRLHQIKGLEVCSRHGIWLERHNPSKTFFQPLSKIIDKYQSPKKVANDILGYYELQQRFAKSANLLLSDQSDMDLEAVKNKFLSLLLDRGLARFNGITQVSKLIDGFRQVYPAPILDRLNIINGNKLFHYIKKYFRRSKSTITTIIIPFMTLDFLGISVQYLLATPQQKHFDGDQDCIHKNCRSIKSSKYYKSQSRKNSTTITATYICRKCNQSFNMDYDISTKETKFTLSPISKYSEKLNKKVLRDQWIKLQNSNPQAGRTKLKQMNGNLFNLLKKYDADWFELNTPKKQYKGKTSKYLTKYWSDKDRVMYSKIQEAYQTLISKPGLPPKISIRAIELIIGVSLRGRINMPFCLDLLNEICESKK